MSAGRKNTSNCSDWCTPKKYVEAIHFVLNSIDLDPCSNSSSIVCAKNNFILPIDGLKMQWHYDNIYINPPYGRDKIRGTSIKDWIEKAYKQSKLGSQILMLIPVATNTTHWKNYIFPDAFGNIRSNAVCFLYDTRLKFLINGNEENKGAPMACSMICYGDKIQSKFNNVFNSYGTVVNFKSEYLKC